MSLKKSEHIFKYNMKRQYNSIVILFQNLSINRNIFFRNYNKKNVKNKKLMSFYSLLYNNNENILMYYKYIILMFI